MPLIDRPIIQYAVEEAVASGIEQIIIVIASGRSAIEDHFDSSPSLERWLEERGDIEMLRTIRRISEFGTVAFVHQREQLGLGHAVLMAKDLVGAEPFAVLLSDDVMLNPAGQPVTKQLIDAHMAHRGSVIAVQRVEPDEVSRYGILDPLHEEGRVVEIRDLVEKPSMEDAPSDLAVLGRYILTPKIFDVLEQTSRGCRRRDPADRWDPGPDRRAAGLRLPVRGHPARCRHATRMAEGERCGRPRVGRRRRVPLLHPRSRPARLTPRGDDRQAHQRPLPPDRPARRGRHGHDLARRRRAAGPGGRRQAAPPPVQRRSGIRRPLQAGGALGRRPLPPEHRRRLRLRHRRSRWRPVHRHGADRGQRPVDDPARPRLTVDVGCRARGDRCRGRPRGRPSQGDRPSRRQARQHPDHRRPAT